MLFRKKETIRHLGISENNIYCIHIDFKLCTYMEWSEHCMVRGRETKYLQLCEYYCWVNEKNQMKIYEEYISSWEMHRELETGLHCLQKE